LLPRQLPGEFTTADIAFLGRVPRRLAQQTAYCLTALGLIERAGKRGNGHVYRMAAGSDRAAGSDPTGPSGWVPPVAGG
jgi:hypothetical protein